MPITIKSPREIELMTEAGRILEIVHDEMQKSLRPGMTTLDIDRLGEEVIRSYGCIPSFLNYNGYPASICVSVNDEVVHGIPSEKRVLKEGDILSVDCTLMLDGWQADSAFTVGVGNISEEARKLIQVTEECFWAGVRKCVVGNRLGDVGHAIELHATRNGFSAVRDYTGHGIGRGMHEDPAVNNYGEPGRGLRLRKGMTLAVEPMICQKDWHLTIDDDGWCARTVDHGLTAHYEHTIAIVDDGLPEILTLPGFSWEGKE